LPAARKSGYSRVMNAAFSILRLLPHGALALCLLLRLAR
jgi:hypothetical protein